MTDEEQEVQQARNLIGEVTLPSEIERIEIKTGVDWAGDPALKVTLWVASALALNREKEDLLTQAAQEVQTKLLRSSLSLYPFVSLDQAA